MTAMRKPNYLSPSALMTYRKDPQEYFLKYLGPKLPDLPQTRPMSVGSAFDYEVKTYIAERVFGKGSTEHLRLGGLFESGVAPHNRDWAREAGRVCMESYTKSGALGRLMTLLDGAEPIMEDTLTREYSTGLVLLGKPDLFFYSNGLPVILDWKVNGYCSSASPKAGYQVLLECLGPQSGARAKPISVHKDYMGMRVGGIEVNIGCYFESVDPSWASQCATYSWLGQGLKFDPDNIPRTVVCIDQLACTSAGRIRVAQHRGCVSTGYQRELWVDYNDLWARIAREHVFDMPLEESRDLQAMLSGEGAGVAQIRADSVPKLEHTSWMDSLLQDLRSF